MTSPRHWLNGNQAWETVVRADSEEGARSTMAGSGMPRWAAPVSPPFDIPAMDLG